jgi:hypothetical protein
MIRTFDNITNQMPNFLGDSSCSLGLEQRMPTHGGLNPEAQSQEELSSHSSEEPLEQTLSGLLPEYAGQTGPSDYAGQTGPSDYAGAAGLSSVKGKGKQKENPIDANNSASAFHAPGGSTGAAGPSGYAGAAELSSVKGKGKQKENPIDANNSASAFHAPGGSTGAAGPSTQKSANFDSWLSSTPENVQNKYAKATDDQKAKMKENYQGVSDRLNRVGSEAKTLPANARQQVEDYKRAADTNLKDGNFTLAKEHLDYAEDKLKNQAASNQAGPSTERKWPTKSDAEYPHKGKHRPGFNTTKASEDTINGKIKQESSKGGPAKYNTSVASEVHQLEKEGFEKGYDINQGTTVHKFPQTIGASEGQLTPYIRLDGTDHGHPITQDQFNDYIQKEANNH